MIFVGAETLGLDYLFNFLERVNVKLASIMEGSKVNTRISNLATFLVGHGYMRSRWLHEVIQMLVVHTLFAKVRKQQLEVGIPSSQLKFLAKMVAWVKATRYMCHLVLANKQDKSTVNQSELDQGLWTLDDC